MKNQKYQNYIWVLWKSTTVYYYQKKVKSSEYNHHQSLFKDSK